MSGSTVQGTARCKRHPAQPAGWVCGACRQSLCADCCEIRRQGVVSTLYVCCLCGGMAKVLTRHRSTTPFLKRVLEAPSYPLSQVGFISLSILALVQAVFSYFGIGSHMYGAFIFLIGKGIFWAYIFSLIRSTARGARKVEVPDFRDVGQDLVMPAIRGMVATSILWVPAVLYMFLALDWSSVLAKPTSLIFDPIIWGLVLLGMVYVPMAILAAATDVSFADMLNPIKVFAYVEKVGKDYWTAVFAIGVLGIADVLLEIVAAFVQKRFPIPFVSRWMAQCIALYVPFVMARVVGLLLYVWGDVLDYGSAHEYEDPVLPGVEPRGRWEGGQAAVKKAAPAVIKPLDLDAGGGDEPQLILGSGEAVVPDAAFANAPALAPTAAAAVGWSRSTEPEPEPELPLGPALASVPAAPPAPAPRPVAPRSTAAPIAAAPAAPALDLDGAGSASPEAARKIAGAIQAQNWPEAMKLYAAIAEFPPGTLGGSHHLALGMAAAKARSYPLAIRALGAAGRTRDAVGGRALITLAQVYGDGMKNAPMADRIYRSVVQQFPGTEFAQFAQRKLG